MLSPLTLSLSKGRRRRLRRWANLLTPFGWQVLGIATLGLAAALTLGNL